MMQSSLPNSRGVTAVCQVVFDVDVGQKVEAVFPAGALSAEEESDVAFHSFPDSMSMELRTKASVRDSSFFFRTKRRPTPSGSCQRFLYGFVFCRQRQDERLRRGGEQRSVVVLSELPLSSVLAPLSRFLGPLALSYGPETLQQVYEEVCSWPPPAWGAPMTLPLGEMGAISAHIPELSTLALPGGMDFGSPQAQALRDGRNLPTAAVQAAASQAATAVPAIAAVAAAAAAATEEAAGRAAAAAAARDEAVGIENWLLAETDDATGLPLCLLPQAYGQQELVVGPFADADAYTPLQHALQQLWSLWEVLVLGEPLLVASPTPAACSGAVAALLSLLAPFPYAADFRPYLTIHDPSFAQLAGGTPPSLKNDLPCLLGVTNLYFIKALPGWPNVLSTGYAAQHAQQAGVSADEGSGGSEGGGSGSMWRSDSGASVASSSGGAGAASVNSKNGSGRSRLGQALRLRAQGPQALLSEPVDALWLAYRPTSRADKEVLGRLVHPKPTDPPDKAARAALLNTMLLRRHFQELTQALLFPLLPYISPAPPPPAPGSPTELQSPPPLPPLDPAAVLHNLADRAGTVPDILLKRFGGHKPLVQFYQRFLESANLQAWLRTRRAVAEQWQARAWREAWWEAGGPLNQPGGGGYMQEVVAVEAFFQLESQMQQLVQAPDEIRALKAQLRSIFAAMPPDLQRSLLLSPRRSKWLQTPDD